METFVCKYSDKGGRPNNEDAIAAGDGIYVLADGLGGHSCGEIASSMTVDFIMKHYNHVESIDNETMHNIINNTNRHIYDAKLANSQYHNMASTVVAAYIQDGMFNYFNVGDSRMYYFRRNKIFLQSHDHSLTQLAVDMGEIKPSAMRFHEDRNKLTKVLGLSENLRIAENFSAFAVEEGDAFLLCSDGFWEYIEEKQMQKILRKSETPQQWMSGMLKEISHNVKEHNDNLSAVCVMVK